MSDAPFEFLGVSAFVMLFAMLRAEKELLVSCLSLAFFASVAWNAAEGQKTELLHTDLAWSQPNWHIPTVSLSG